MHSNSLRCSKEARSQTSKCQQAILTHNCDGRIKLTYSCNSSKGSSGNPHFTERTSERSLKSLDTSSDDLRCTTRNGHQSRFIAVGKSGNESLDIFWCETEGNDCLCNARTKLLGESSVED